jgi:hypothetical protein
MVILQMDVLHEYVGKSLVFYCYGVECHRIQHGLALTERTGILASGKFPLEQHYPMAFHSITIELYSVVVVANSTVWIADIRMRLCEVLLHAYISYPHSAICHDHNTIKFYCYGVECHRIQHGLALANPLFLIQIELTLFPMLLQWKFT